ncbi:MAG: hypothetical protein ACJASX_000188 [Limisphaerales bacterium]|jgi:hypothetical protein
MKLSLTFAIACTIASSSASSAPQEKAPAQGQGCQQANTMGGGPAAIPRNGKFRVFLLAGQSNMTGQGRAIQLKPPLNLPHDRIRIWAHNRWEQFVPTKSFGPGLNLAHEFAKLWPDDTIGVIKVAIGGTGISSFQPDWTKESADRSKDGRKGNLYQDITEAVTAARKISEFALVGFAWKQGGKDMRYPRLAKEYLSNFRKMISGLRKDLNVPDLPAFIATYGTREEFENFDGPINKSRPGAFDVIKAQLDAADQIPNVVAFSHGKLPCHKDGIHFNTEGQLILGKMFADSMRKYLADR